MGYIRECQILLRVLLEDGSDVVGPIIVGTAVVAGGALVGYTLGTDLVGQMWGLPYFPSNRSALAMMLWEDAGKPMPESELLYPDVEQEERDMDLQHAARWAMENELIPDLNDEGTAPEEMKFFPANTVSKLDVLNAWQKAQELKSTDKWYGVTYREDKPTVVAAIAQKAQELKNN